MKKLKVGSRPNQGMQSFSINMKLILSGIFTLTICFFLNAEEAVNSAIYYGDIAVIGKENIFDENAAVKANNVSQARNNQTKISSDGSSYIYIAEKTEVYDKEHLFIQKNASSKVVKKAAKVKKEASAHVENKITEQKPIEIVFPFLPFAPSSLSFSYRGGGLAVVSPQPRVGGGEQASKAFRENPCQSINEPDLSLYTPKQRYKLSVAAIQCGELTSFGSQSPPALS